MSKLQTYIITEDNYKEVIDKINDFFKKPTREVHHGAHIVGYQEIDTGDDSISIKEPILKNGLYDIPVIGGHAKEHIMYREKELYDMGLIKKRPRPCIAVCKKWSEDCRPLFFGNKVRFYSEYMFIENGISTSLNKGNEKTKFYTYVHKESSKEELDNIEKNGIAWFFHLYETESDDVRFDIYGDFALCIEDLRNKLLERVESAFISADVVTNIVDMDIPLPNEDEYDTYNLNEIKVIHAKVDMTNPMEPVQFWKCEFQDGKVIENDDTASHFVMFLVSELINRESENE